MTVPSVSGPLSVGGKALRLLLDQPSWTHRRVESLSFLANGETRRAISWDFTLPPELAIAAPGHRIAIPIAAVRKGPLKRFNLRDAGGRALPVWGTHDNGALAVELLVSGLEGVRGEPVDQDLRTAISRVVFADHDQDVSDALVRLREGARGGQSSAPEEVLLAYDSLVATLARSFVLVVEAPDELIGTRAILKASYEDERSKQAAQVNLMGRVDIDLEANGWGNAASWHLEVQAPDGIRVARLRHETWDPDTSMLTSESSDMGGGSTAHITAGGVSPYDEFSADVRLVVVPRDVVNAVGGDEASDAGVGSVVIVGVQPVGVGRCTSGV